MNTPYLSIARAAELLSAGSVVAIPTETVYGLAANVFHEKALAAVFDAKERPHFDPLIVHIANLEQVHRVVRHWPSLARTLAQAFWPGPLTLILPRQTGIPDLVTAGLDTVGVRLPRHPICREIIEMTGAPLAAPSANSFGRTSPTTPIHVLEQLDGRIDGIVDGGPCSVGVESTIISLVDTPTLLRPGGVPLEAIEELIGPVLIGTSSVQPGALLAPGTLPGHYATRTPLFLEKIPEQKFRLGFLTFGPQEPSTQLLWSVVRNLSPSGNLQEAAAALYATLRELDTMHLDAIVATTLPEEGLGRAINDRLRRASAGSQGIEIPIP